MMSRPTYDQCACTVTSPANITDQAAETSIDHGHNATCVHVEQYVENTQHQQQTAIDHQALKYDDRALAMAHTGVMPAGQPNRPYSVWQLPHNTHVCFWSSIS